MILFAADTWSELLDWFGEIHPDAWLQAIATFVAIVVSVFIAVWSIRHSDKKAREASRLALAKESRDLLESALLRAEMTVSRTHLLAPVLEVSLHPAEYQLPRDGWAASVLSALDAIGGPEGEEFDVHRVVTDHAPLLEISGRTTHGALWVYLVSTGDLISLRLKVEGASDSAEGIKRTCEPIKEVLDRSSAAESVLRDMRALVAAQYRHLLKDDSSPFTGGTTFTWTGVDWVPNKEVADAFDLSPDQTMSEAEGTPDS